MDLALKKEKLLIEKEACEYLHCSNVTLWRLRKEGRITFYKLGGKILYRAEDLEEYINKNKVVATSAALTRQEF